ncbi:hypothetical protein QQ020_19580 [Fulvivirgaceae bacterium BMA12]|uniref:Lipoprotein n=1 Tax=Agaribacillus aureus TaxID=3051825 RepID=A0ABT8L954_9BACT|nr:hypothetical protein [Fulvivirgaceae bacterium BMA12]
MKIFSLTSKVILLALITAGLGACYDQEDPLDDLIDRSGNFYPEIANIRTLENQGLTVDFSAGGTVFLEMQYWSIDPIDEVNVYDIIGSDTSLISNTPYEPAFSQRSGTDTLVFDYTVPMLPVDTRITLLFEVVNQNTLSYARGYSFNIE